MASILSFSIISILSRLIGSQFLEQDVPQMRQGFPKLYRIDQRLTISVFPIQTHQLLPSDHKGRHASSVVLDVDCGKLPAVAQKEGASEDVRRLYALGHAIHLLSTLLLMLPLILMPMLLDFPGDLR
jgi:hypothetical protein